jgi:hypothetical protein
VVGEMALKQVFSEFLRLPLVIVIPPLPPAHISPSPEKCDSSDKAANYHIFGLQIRDLIADPTHGWLDSKEGSYFVSNPKSITAFTSSRIPDPDYSISHPYTPFFPSTPKPPK